MNVAGFRPMFPAPSARVRMIGDFASDSNNAAFSSAWQQVAGQLNTEGTPPGSITYLAAQTAFASSFDQLAPSINSIGGTQLLKSCTDYALAGTTIGGAVDQVTGLISAAASGEPAPQLLETFTGTMIGLAVTSGALTAGVGAAIIGAVSILVSVLQGAGLFGGAPGVQIPGCGGTSFNPAPDWAIGCSAAYGNKNTPGSFGWIHFPNPSNAQDAVWFQPPPLLGSGGVVNWRGLTVTPQLIVGNRPPPIQSIFPLLAAIDVENNLLLNLLFRTLPAPVQDFHRAFLAGWKLNQEYALNGLNPQADWQVLYHAINLWNAAHDSSVTYSLRDSGATPLYEANSLIGSPGTLSSNINQSDPIWDPASNGHAVLLNIGPRKNFTLGSSFAAPSSASTGKVLAYSAGGIAVGGLALAAWQARSRRTSIRNVVRGWGSNVRRLVRR